MSREFLTDSRTHIYDNDPIEIVQDTSLEIEITLEFENDLGKIKPYSLEDSEVQFAVRKRAATVLPSIEKTSLGPDISLFDAENGKFRITIRPADTFMLLPGKYVYDIKVVTLDGEKYVPVKGDFIVVAGVSRPVTNVSSGSL